MAIHGNKSQNARTRALAGFRTGAIDTLIATDIAARGLDVDGISHVVNFDLPNVPEDYVHRIGRTARAGKSGAAISLAAPEERTQLVAIERLIGTPIRREQIVGFTPAPDADQSSPPRRPQAPQAFRASRQRSGSGRATGSGAGGDHARNRVGRGRRPSRRV